MITNCPICHAALKPHGCDDHTAMEVVQALADQRDQAIQDLTKLRGEVLTLKKDIWDTLEAVGLACGLPKIPKPWDPNAPNDFPEAWRSKPSDQVRETLAGRDAEIARLRIELERLEESNKSFLSLKEMHAVGGKIDITMGVAQEIVEVITGAMQVMLVNAKNYVECDLQNRAGDRFTFTIQKRAARTPHDLVEEAEVLIRALVKRLPPHHIDSPSLVELVNQHLASRGRDLVAIPDLG